MTTKPIPARVAQLDVLQLGRGSHASFSDGHCPLEVAAWLAGEPHTDRPACVHPVLAEEVRLMNDITSTEDRQRLKAILPDMVGTAGTADPDRTAALAYRAYYAFCKAGSRVSDEVLELLRSACHPDPATQS